ncbi:hypothetical protein OESDEN_17437 [Oesophagostomum dentatum]|uniref:Uncharacterized protein n=1 Tax=Oesophagostomum dentatum TaxID=61180 RepID=A0A0B1SC31_OESDE|nr:hypothetical protein OESDEN_17437 [Oesophagostomum dentatum]
MVIQLLSMGYMSMKSCCWELQRKNGTVAQSENRTEKFELGLGNDNSNRLAGLFSAARLFHDNSMFMKMEHRR